MNFQIFASRKHFTTTGKRTVKRFFPGVHSNMVHQFVFGLKRSTVSRTVLPITRVIRNLRPANMFHPQMTNNLRHGGEMFAADLFGGRLIRINPQTLHFLFDRSHILEETGSVEIAWMVRHRHGVMVEVLMMVGLVSGMVIGA